MQVKVTKKEQHIKNSQIQVDEIIMPYMYIRWFPTTKGVSMPL